MCVSVWKLRRRRPKVPMFKRLFKKMMLIKLVMSTFLNWCKNLILLLKDSIEVQSKKYCVLSFFIYFSSNCNSGTTLNENIYDFKLTKLKGSLYSKLLTTFTMGHNVARGNMTNAEIVK